MKLKWPIFHLSADKHFGLVVFFTIWNQHRKWCLVSIFYQRRNREKKSIYLPRHFLCGVLNHLCGTQTNAKGYLSVKSLFDSDGWLDSVFAWTFVTVNIRCAIAENCSINFMRHLYLNGRNFNVNRTMEQVVVKFSMLFHLGLFWWYNIILDWSISSSILT